MDKTPRLQPHTVSNPEIMSRLDRRGAEMHHVNPHIREYEQKLGQMSLTDEIIREAPDADEAV